MNSIDGTNYLLQTLSTVMDTLYSGEKESERERDKERERERERESDREREGEREREKVREKDCRKQKPMAEFIGNMSRIEKS